MAKGSWLVRLGSAGGSIVCQQLLFSRDALYCQHSRPRDCRGLSLQHTRGEYVSEGLSASRSCFCLSPHLFEHVILSWANVTSLLT